MKIRHALAAAIVCLALLQPVLADYFSPPQNTLFALDTVITADIRGMSRGETKRLLAGAFDICRAYEGMLSPSVSGNIVDRLNRGETVEVPADVGGLIAKAGYYSRISGGAFDITVKPMVDLWNVNIGRADVPAGTDIERALSLVDYNRVEIDGGGVTLSGGAQIDLGGIAKGFIGDKMKEYLLANGCESAIINLGGNVVTIGVREDGQPWVVGVQQPFRNQGALAGKLRVTGESVVTSGRYERYFVNDGVIYHHIIDPETGYPAENGLDSVTIVCAESADADALTTACFVLGPEEGLALAESLEGVEALFLLQNGETLLTTGMAAYMVVDE